MKYDPLALRALNNTESYSLILYNQQRLLEALAQGDSKSAVNSFYAWIPSYADGNTTKLSGNNLEDRKMQGFMILSLMLHQGYLLQLPVNSLYMIFEIYTTQFMFMKTLDDFERISVAAIEAMCSLVQEKCGLIKNKYVVIATLYIQSNLTKPLLESDISNMVGLSVSRLNVLFKEELNCTLYEYVLNKKIEASAKLLMTTSFPVSQIAAEFCFASASHFGIRFKERFGCTPLQFRKKSRNHLASVNNSKN